MLDERTWNAVAVSEEPGLPPGTATLLGSVIDQAGNPLAGVLATLTSLGIGGEGATVSDTEGLFEFRNIAADNYKLICTKAGYKPSEQYVVLESGGNEVTIILQKVGELPWMWLAIGGAVLAGGILLIPKAKKAIKRND